MAKVPKTMPASTAGRATSAAPPGTVGSTSGQGSPVGGRPTAIDTGILLSPEQLKAVQNGYNPQYVDPGAQTQATNYGFDPVTGYPVQRAGVTGYQVTPYNPVQATYTPLDPTQVQQQFNDNPISLQSQEQAGAIQGRRDALAALQARISSDSASLQGSIPGLVGRAQGQVANTQAEYAAALQSLLATQNQGAAAIQGDQNSQAATLTNYLQSSGSAQPYAGQLAGSVAAGGGELNALIGANQALTQGIGVDNQFASKRISDLLGFEGSAIGAQVGQQANRASYNADNQAQSEIFNALIQAAGNDAQNKTGRSNAIAQAMIGTLQGNNSGQNATNQLNTQITNTGKLENAQQGTAASQFTASATNASNNNFVAASNEASRFGAETTNSANLYQAQVSNSNEATRVATANRRGENQAEFESNVNVERAKIGYDLLTPDLKVQADIRASKAYAAAGIDPNWDAKVNPSAAIPTATVNAKGQINGTAAYLTQMRALTAGEVTARLISLGSSGSNLPPVDLLTEEARQVYLSSVARSKTDPRYAGLAKTQLDSYAQKIAIQKVNAGLPANAQISLDPSGNPIITPDPADVEAIVARGRRDAKAANQTFDEAKGFADATKESKATIAQLLRVNTQTQVAEVKKSVEPYLSSGKAKGVGDGQYASPELQGVLDNMLKDWASQYPDSTPAAKPVAASPIPKTRTTNRGD